MTGHYRLIDHTADFGLEIFGDDVAALFEHAAAALFEQLTATEGKTTGQFRAVDVMGDDWPDLMVNWLRELLYLFNGEHKIVYRVAVTFIEETRLSAMVWCVDYAPELHDVRNEIKAVTYHQVEVGPREGVWRAQIIFDV